MLLELLVLVFIVYLSLPLSVKYLAPGETTVEKYYQCPRYSIFRTLPADRSLNPLTNYYLGVEILDIDGISNFTSKKPYCPIDYRNVTISSQTNDNIASGDRRNDNIRETSIVNTLIDGPCMIIIRNVNNFPLQLRHFGYKGNHYRYCRSGSERIL